MGGRGGGDRTLIALYPSLISLHPYTLLHTHPHLSRMPLLPMSVSDPDAAVLPVYQALVAAVAVAMAELAGHGDDARACAAATAHVLQTHAHVQPSFRITRLALDGRQCQGAGGGVGAGGRG